MNKKLLLTGLIGVAVVSSQVMAADSFEDSTEKNRALIDKKSHITQHIAKGKKMVTDMERSGSDPVNIGAMYTNLNVSDLQLADIELEMSINVLADANKKRKQEIEALTARVAALEAKS